jgi:hypothetical protein
MLLKQNRWVTRGRMSLDSAPGSLDYHPGKEAALEGADRPSKCSVWEKGEEER